MRGSEVAAPDWGVVVAGDALFRPCGRQVGADGPRGLRPLAADRRGVPARAHDAIAETVRAAGLRVSVGAPIVLEGRLCGVTSASWQREQSPPPDTEERMVQFAGPPSCPASIRSTRPRAQAGRRASVRDVAGGQQGGALSARCRRQRRLGLHHRRLPPARGGRTGRRLLTYPDVSATLGTVGSHLDQPP